MLLNFLKVVFCFFFEIAANDVIHVDLTNVDFGRCSQISIEKGKFFSTNKSNFQHEIFKKIFFEGRNGGGEWEKVCQITVH